MPRPRTRNTTVDRKQKQHRLQSNQSELFVCIIIALNQLGGFIIDKGTKISSVTKDFFKVGIFHYYSPDGNIEEIDIRSMMKMRKKTIINQLRRNNESITRWEHICRWERVHLLEDILWYYGGNVIYEGEEQTYGIDCKFKVQYGESFEIDHQMRTLLVKPITEFIVNKMNGNRHVIIEKDELIHKSLQIIDEFNESKSSDIKSDEMRKEMEDVMDLLEEMKEYGDTQFNFEEK